MPRRVHLAYDELVVSVLWLRGLTEPIVGALTGLTRKQVNGIVNRSPYRGRSQMTDGERQAHLSDLENVDWTALTPGRVRYRPRESDFVILPLQRNQIRGEAS